MKEVLQSDKSPTGSPLTDFEVSFIASTLPLAAIIGAPMCLYIAEVYGRKLGILATMLFYAISWLIKIFATRIELLIIARICSGFASGGTFLVIPMYVREIAQDNIRGTLVSLTMSLQHLGVLIIYAMGTYLEYHTTLCVTLGISIAPIFLIPFSPESPVFLVNKGKFDEAAKSLSTLRGLEIDDATIVREVEYLKNEDAFYKSEKKISFTAIFKNKAWCRGFFLCLILACFIEFHGSFAMVTYAWTIMGQAVSVSPKLQSLIIPTILMCGSILPMILVEKVGRKLLLTVTYVVSAVALGCLASAMLVQQNGVEIPNWVPGLSVAVTVFAYSAGVLPMPSVIMNDMLRYQVRGKLLGIIYILSWTSASLQLLLFVPVSDALGMSSVFYICMAVNVAGALIVLFFVPETRCRTEEEIEAILSGNKIDRCKVTNS